ncbi:MAG: YlzJ-like family protein [Syntrophomonadaceae bacterium]|nr:YlzJ-like family protein [Syntrophomonadaceae bacterium]MDD3888303.1 YlzJ-like family protein [Syntrophomonadaceae bacterium]MDD4548810.1 YlzJ-like family protein [Syntrophomonadaceae bacterium]
MIIYAPDPFDLLDKSESRQKIVMQLPSGGLVTAEVCDNNSLRVVSLNSTDPMDYMQSNYQPGSIISLGTRLKLTD